MSEVPLHAINRTNLSPHLLPFPLLANWARPTAAVGCFCPFRLSPDSFGQFGCHGVDELLVPMLRIENLEVRSGIAQNILTEIEHGFHCYLVLVHQVEQSAHVPRGLLRLPACLQRAQGSTGACVFSRARCNL